MIRYLHQPDGGFLAGDTSTGIAAYAYPTSTHGSMARRDPGRAARAMVACSCKGTDWAFIRRPEQVERNARWMARLTEHGTGVE